jgi:hypothetical protein
MNISDDTFIPRLATLPPGPHPSKDIIFVIGKLHAASLLAELMNVPAELIADFHELDAAGYHAKPGAVAAILLVISEKCVDLGWVDDDDPDESDPPTQPVH